MLSEDKLKFIISQFQITESIATIRPLKLGHINDTFIFKTVDSKKYVLQHINNDVFKNIPELMDNVSRLLSHVNKKLEGIKSSDRYPKIIPTLEDKSFYIDDSGEYWRIYTYVLHTASFQKCESVENAYEAASCASRFQMYISELENKDFFETIPLFHNLPNRYLQFHKALSEDRFDRASTAKEIINFCLEREKFKDKITKLIESKKIPLRVIHNDLKFNNILFDKTTNKAVSVVDLDTVMSGTLLYDFGDLVRSASVKADEDEKDLNKVFMDINLFEALLKGYTENLKDLFSQEEKDLLYYAPRNLTFTIGLRFLTDYLNGDKYFKIQYATHNLDRARNQFAVVKSMEEQENEMKKIVKEAFK